MGGWFRRRFFVSGRPPASRPRGPRRGGVRVVSGRGRARLRALTIICRVKIAVVILDCAVVMTFSALFNHDFLQPRRATI